jgi:hypothetical protein
MIYSINPNLFAGIPDTFLKLKYTDDEGPIIAALEKSAIRFDPPGTAPETEAEWDAVTDSLGKTLEPLVLRLVSQGDDIVRMSEQGIWWRYVLLTAKTLAENGVELRTMAHSMRGSGGNGAAIGALRDQRLLPLRA